MAKRDVYKIVSGGADYYYLTKEEAEATGHSVETIETFKGSDLIISAMKEKPVIQLVEEVEEVVEEVEEVVCEGGECKPEDECEPKSESDFSAQMMPKD